MLATTGNTLKFIGILAKICFHEVWKPQYSQRLNRTPNVATLQYHLPGLF